MAADQFCLRWNNFQINITSALESLKCDEDLVDVTLTCDGQNVKAHKVILSACSPYFRNVFKENPCQHPVVILKDVSFEDVTALLNFMYQGEVYITQDRLAPFLHTAELLQVRGLAGATNPFKDSQPPAQQQQKQQQKPKKQVHATSGQLRRSTPPLSISPSTVPHQTSGKALPFSPFRSSKSPMVSPVPKDSHSTSIPAFHVKDKSVSSHPFILGRDSDPSHLKPPHTPLNPSTSLHQSSSGNYQLSTSSEQSSTSYQPAHSDPQPYQPNQLHSTLTTPTTYQSHTTEPSNTSSLQYSSAPVPDEQSSSQPASPQPKRRKAFPRRLSSGPLPLDDVTGGESQVCEVVHVVPGTVKQEPIDEDEEMEGETGCDEDADSLRSEDMDASGTGTGYYSHPDADSEEPISLDRDIVKEEAGTEGTSEIAAHSVLLRSLTGAPPHSLQQTDDFGRPSIPHPHHRSLWRCMQPRVCPICFKTFSNSFNLKQHVQNVHLPSQGIQCHVCRKAFKNKRYLRKHLVTFHGAPLRRIRTQDGQIIHLRDDR